MRIVFSRKGFDSEAGGTPSPIISNRPISLPIPTTRRSETTYGTIGLGEIVATVTKGRLGASNLCHEDPMFFGGKCAFGQTGNAQAHLEKQAVGVGDTFLFFGLFLEEGSRDPHHRIFGYLHIEKVNTVGAKSGTQLIPKGFPRRHPHTIGEWNDNNTIYVGRGTTAKFAHLGLRLSKPEGPTSRWRIPAWLSETGLTYHRKPDRWSRQNELQVVGRGQEFVANIGDRKAPHEWLMKMITLIETPRSDH